MEVTYTCRYSSGYLIPNSVIQTELVIKYLTSISADLGDLHCFTTFSCFFVSLLFCFLIPNTNYDNSIHL